MKRYVYAELTEEEAALLGDLLPMGEPHLDELRQKLIPATIPALPGTVMVLHDQHTAYRAVLLLDDLATRPWQELEAMRLGAYEEYGQEISDVISYLRTFDAGDAEVARNAFTREAGQLLGLP